MPAIPGFKIVLRWAAMGVFPSTVLVLESKNKSPSLEAAGQ